MAQRASRSPHVRARPGFVGDEIHLQVLKACLRRRDRNAWNRWRRHNPGVVPDLRGVVLPGADLSRWNLADARLDHALLDRVHLGAADLRRASFTGARLLWAVLSHVKAGQADFSGTNCRHAQFDQSDCREAVFLDSAYLAHANLRQADLRGARMAGATLSRADLSQARLDRADLSHAQLNDAVLDETSLRGANLRGAHILGTFIRRVRTDKSTDQRELFVDAHVAWERKPGEMVHITTADDLRVAQFHNIVDEPGAVGKLLAATTQRVVLILGRFTPQRKRVLSSLARALGARGKIAIIFDFPTPAEREISDTVRFIAGMSEFIVVDLTDASSVPLELQATIPDLMVPVLPIIQSGRRAFAMFADLQRRYFWIQPTLQYGGAAQLVRHVDRAIIARAQQAAQVIGDRRAAAAGAPQRLSGLGMATERKRR